jgi:hypothetical protein
MDNNFLFKKYSLTDFKVTILLQFCWNNHLLSISPTVKI